jgi:predicted enzyme related to lactoylglutathione lyase
MNPVVHFEMPAEDRKRIANFYSKVFGWKTEQLGEDMRNYVLATTTESNENGRPKKPGAINGGFFQKTDDGPAQYPSVVIAVDDINMNTQKLWKTREARFLANHGIYPESASTCRFLIPKATGWA